MGDVNRVQFVGKGGGAAGMLLLLRICLINIRFIALSELKILHSEYNITTYLYAISNINLSLKKSMLLNIFI